MKNRILAAVLFAAVVFHARADWLINTYRNGNTINNLSDADALISSTAPIASTNITEADLLGENPGSGSGHFSVNNPVPGIPQNQTIPNYAVQGTGFLEIAVAGNYTFALNTDDGARLRIDGVDVIVDNSQHGPSDSAYVTTNLSVGLHAVEWTWFNAGGGAEGEAFAAPGQITSFNSTFTLLGDPNGIPVVQTNAALPPHVTVQPASQFVQVGSNATFSVVANGQPPLFYQWFFNNGLIIDATNATLVLNSVAVTNAGLYSLTVSNSVGSTNSVAASLNIYAAILGQGWLIKTYWNGSSVNGLADADALINGGFIIASTNMAQGDMLGFNSGEGTGHFSVNNPVPGIPNDHATDNYAVQGTGYLVVPNDGQYTFGLNTDDGARLTIDGINIIVDNVRSPPHDSPYVTVSLSAGLHPVVWTWYNEAGGNNGGGAEGEIFAAPGVHSGFDSSFQLVGSTPGLIVAQDYSTPIVALQTNRIPKDTEIGQPTIPTDTNHFKVFTNGAFQSGIALDPAKMTVILTHGWKGSPSDWAAYTAQIIQQRIWANTVNLVAWDWHTEATNPLPTATQLTLGEGHQLGTDLSAALGTGYSQRIHFIGHSLGTLVNAAAADYLHNHGFSWTNTQMTLCDEAEVAWGTTSQAETLASLFALLNNSSTSQPFWFGPLPRQCNWADNYISACGMLHTQAANVILTWEFPTSFPNFDTLKTEFYNFHDFAHYFYEDTIEPSIFNTGGQTNATYAGFICSFEGGGSANRPATNTYFYQDPNGYELTLVQTNQSFATNFLNQRLWSYVGTIKSSGCDWAVDEAGNAVLQANGQVQGTVDYARNLIINLFTSVGSGSPVPNSPHPLKGPTPNGGPGGANNSPAYAWIPLYIPSNTISMTFDFMLQGDGASDSFQAALNGTNILSLETVLIQTNMTLNSGMIDVSPYAGQTNEFFVGIVGGTSTNAQMTVQNLVFYSASAPPLQAQSSGNNPVLTWPISATGFNLQCTTNLADPNSWMTLANVPAIVNSQSTVTNSISGGAQFYRLKK